MGYRYFAKSSAQRMGVAGYAKNLHDGRVEVYAIGPGAILEAFRGELNRGPRPATVSAVTEEDAPFDAQFAQGFSIEHDKW